MRKLYVFLFLLVSVVVFPQEDAWVYFKDKPSATTFLNAPLQMLSQRALDRRENQKIVLDLKDVPIEADYVAQINAVVGIDVKAKSKWLNAVHVRGTSTLINSLRSISFVASVDFANKSLNQTGKTTKEFKSKISSKTKQTKINFSYGNAKNQIEMLNGTVLHQQNFTGSGKIIAVLDSGFPGVNTTVPFERLRVNNQILGGYNFVDRDANFYGGDTHGSYVLATMGGYKENELVGTAPDASYYLFVTEDALSENPLEESLWVEAAEEADRLGVDIINSSLGYFDFDNSAYDHTYSQLNGSSTFISKGAEIAYSRGMIVVTSAGNSGGSSNPYITAPADAVSVIAVGAVNAAGVRANFSSIGPSFDNRVKPDVMAQGVSSVLSDEKGNIITADGTSFSSPILAGMIACLWQAFPDKTNSQIRDLVLKSSDRFTSPSAQYGYGIPNFATAKTLQVVEFGSKYFGIYPNPATDLITVSFPENFNKGSVIFYSILGQKVFEKQLNESEVLFSVDSLNKGIYIYKIESEAFSQTGKIIKQ
ncbi:MAG: S8 family serine peptidase [Bacteroidetes bacterium]|nr:S8 family serine peptidase [Bacteroidota bacterium]